MATTPNLPNPESYEQLLSDMLSAYAAKLGINDFNVGSVNTSFFEVVALATARASGDLFQVLRDFSVDRATGDALKRLAQEYNVIPIVAGPATGNVNVIDTSFTKIFTKIYSGTLSPNIGATTINVSDASLFPATGSVYIGRGTPNVEGPLPYTVAPFQVGSYWTITLSVPTAKFHNLGETVVLAQGGNRTIPTNTVVLSPGVGSSPDIQYSVITTAIILDGETEVDNVQVSALTPGSKGNVPAGSIKSFASVPFSGATVTNPLPFTTGSDNETDSQLRVRIKRALASQGLGTATAVEASLIGAFAADENDTIVSDSLTKNTDGSATVYIDDGTGYEAKSAGVGLEFIVDSALGGEQFFQLQTGGSQAPVAKAFLQTTLGAPFDIIGGDTLAVVVGEITYQHTFLDSDFVTPGGATAFEITASINADSTLGFEATTAGGGVYVVIRAKAETNDSIHTTIPTITSGRDASVQLGFPSNTIETLRLYKNNIPLTKDGILASVFTQAQQLWSPTISSGETLILSVDGTAFITYTILDADFLNTGLYTFVSFSNSLASWVEVFNNKLTGVTATIVGDQIELTSNLGASNRAAVSISGSSTLVTKGMFSLLLGLSADGKASDFTLDRNTAQFELVVPLVAGDQLSAGSSNTEAFIESAQIASGTLTFSADAHFWLLIDSPGTIIKTGAVANTTLAVSKPSSNILRYTSSVSGAFANVLTGDYVIIWTPELPAEDRIEGRVHAVTSTTLDILVTAAEYAAATVTSVTILESGFVVLRSALAPQKFRVQAGTKTLFQIASELQTQTENIIFSVFLQQYLKMVTATLDNSGSLLVVTADSQAAFLQLPLGLYSQSQDSLIAYRNSQEYAGDLPLFVNSVFSDAFADPIDTFIPSIVSSMNLSARDPNELLGILHPYGVIRDAQCYGEYVQETFISGTTVGITEDPYVRRVRSIDRFFLANPLDFGNNDTIVAILDNNVIDESFEIPLYRKALTNTNYTTNPSNFDAYDVDSGATAQFSTAFGPTFDFANFKVLMQAKKVLKPIPPQTAILYRSTPWGRSGEKITVGYAYPSAANQPVSSMVVVSTTVAITIFLGSGVPSLTSIDSTTQWNVTVTANTPSAGTDQVTYTWNGIGSSPTLSLSGGEYVNITSQTGFNTANIGVFRVSTQAGFTPTATSFSVQMPTGVAVVQSNVPTQVNGAILFYTASPTTAASVVSYVNANLPLYISATLVNDGGLTGSGIISKSTYEDSGFAYRSVSLLDGINWIASSNLSANVVTTSGNTTFPSNILTGVFPTTDIRVGASVSGPGINPGSTVVSINGSTVVLSLNVLSSNTGATLVFTNTGSPQFIFKRPLALPTDVGYAFNNGEIIRLIPTTMDQVKRLISVFAVSGFISDGSINLADRDKYLELSTNILGSSGAIQISGGLGNQYQVPILDSAVLIDNSHIEVSVNNVASQGVLSDQWFRLQAATAQKKDINISSNTNVTVTANTPAAGSSEIRLLNRTLTQRYFGKARSNISLNGLTFRVEKQGNLVCVTWTGSDPAGLTTSHLSTSTNFNSGGGGTLNISLVPNTSDAQYFIATGAATFSGLSIGDLVTISGLTPSANNGTFSVTGVSDDGKTIQITNSNAVAASGASFVNGNFAATSGVTEGDTVIFGSPFALLNQGTFRVIRRFTDSFWIENPNVVEEEQVLTGSSLTFYEYEATVPGDKFVVTGSILGANNVGTYIVTQVLNLGGGHYNDTVVVSSTMTTTGSINLTGFETALYLQEGTPYSGYKHVFLVSSEPSAPTRNIIVFDSVAQYEKIDGAAGVQMTSLNKLDFKTALQMGLDSYRYNTGLIAEANRIVYGDPRDPITYPGVGAAGADIFIREPLTLRVTMAIDIRLLTGAPFTAVSQQVRSNIASLVNSNPVGQSIDISSIIAVARSVPGVISVAIDSPLYNSSNDLIAVAPSEKTRIIDQSVDISVSQIGS